jgi:hypothetical protein
MDGPKRRLLLVSGSGGFGTALVLVGWRVI